MGEWGWVIAVIIAIRECLMRVMILVVSAEVRDYIRWITYRTTLFGVSRCGRNT